MAKKNKRRRRQGIVSKVANIGIILLGFSRVIELAMKQQFEGLIGELTFGFSDQGRFNLARGLRVYMPGVAAVGLGKFKQYLMRHFPVR